ncbi:hypothetical protein [Agrobacterium deltaense]|uniref:hypothetical protein n=1 Tax=Agrobacterium deltaense TaxID=1183412 RepID=UPI000F63749A|nr:hypothetical protein [Agrobacterium deltaense]RRN67657.1 hypothetical protein EIQ31_22485 [Agrobacterium deltaense]
MRSVPFGGGAFVSKKGFFPLNFGNGSDLLQPPSSSFSFLDDIFGVRIKKKRRAITHGYDQAKSMPSAVAQTYCVKPSGDDLAAGTSMATAFATLKRAISMIMFGGMSQSLIGRIVVDTSGGDVIFLGSNGLQNVTCRKSLLIFPTGPGRVISVSTVGSATSFEWTGAGNPAIYATPCASAPGYVFDLKRIVPGSPANAPEYELLVLGSSASTLAAGQYFYDSANATLYVRAADDRAPGSTIVPTTTGSGFAWGPQLSGQVLWSKGMDIIGGYQTQIDYTYMADATAQAYLNDVTFQGSGLDGFVMTRPGYSLLSGCGAYNTTGDGFSSYAGAGGNTLAVNWRGELDCRARRNGKSANLANNASTGHDASRTVIVNPDYDLSQDRLVHFVYASLVWIVGGKLGRSARAAGASSRTLMVNQGAVDRTPIMWLDSVEMVGHSEIDIEASNYGRILMRDVEVSSLTKSANTNGFIGGY